MIKMMKEKRTLEKLVDFTHNTMGDTKLILEYLYTGNKLKLCGKEVFVNAAGEIYLMSDDIQGVVSGTINKKELQLLIKNECLEFGFIDYIQLQVLSQMDELMKGTL